MDMRKNVGSIDRVIRVAIAVALVWLAAVGLVTGPLLWAAVTAAVIMLATAATGFCPIYAMMGLSTSADRR